MKKILKILIPLVALVLIALTACKSNSINKPVATSASETIAKETKLTVSENGQYTSKEEVALYIHLYNHLPSNYITKTQAKKRGWVQGENDIGEVLPGMSIGGGSFGNNEGLLPKKDGREYYECDIDYDGKKRNGKRIVYSNDGLIFYTGDHYERFEQLY